VSQHAVTIIMASASLVALGLLVPSIRSAQAARDLDASTALTLGMGWLLSLPAALVAITGSLSRRLDAFRQLATILPGWYITAERLALLLVTALAAGLLLKRLRSARIPVHAAGLFAISLWALAHLASGIQGGPLLSPRGAVLLACLLAATVLPRGRGAALGAGIFGVTLASASGALAVFRYDVAFVVPCEGACGGLGFSGLLPNPNLLGIVLVACIPFAYLGFRGRARGWLAVYLAGMAIATGSQTAIGAAVITLIALFVARPRLAADRTTPAQAATAGLVLAGAVSATVYFPLHHWDPSALSDRPVIWRVAANYIHDSPWIGYGPDKWAGLYRSSEIFQAAQRSAHNQWLDVLFAAGWLGAALLVCVVVATLLSSGHAAPGVALATATIAMIGATEGAWAIGTYDLMSFSLIALILTGATSDRTSREPLDRATIRARQPVATLAPPRAVV
jgi:O-antigen ligase